jgi:transcriptional regulator with XRE-family HTH domain
MINERIREARRNVKMTQDALAKRIKVTKRLFHSGNQDLQRLMVKTWSTWLMLWVRLQNGYSLANLLTINR